MLEDKTETTVTKDNAYYYEENLKRTLPKNNVHKNGIDVETLIDGFASIPLYDRVGIPIADIPDDIMREMESSATTHYVKFLEKLKACERQTKKAILPLKKSLKLPLSTPSEGLVHSVYGSDFSSDCLKYLKGHSSKPFNHDAIIFDESDMVEVEKKDPKLWKTDFNQFLSKFEGDPNRTLAIISSEESELSEEQDEGYDETYDMVEKFERLGKIINASASMVIKEKKILPPRCLNMDFDDLPCVVNKPYPHEIPTALRDFDNNAQERERRRVERSKIRREREKRRLQRISHSKGEVEQALLPHPMMETSNTVMEPEEKKKSRKTSSSSDDDDLKHLEWKANNKIKSKLSKEKRKRSSQIDKSFKKKGL